jgi:alcohol dehydrogenase (cytochrome c)
VVANAKIDPRVRNGALGFTGAMSDLPKVTVGGNSLLVFSLGPAASASTSPAPPPASPPAPAQQSPSSVQPPAAAPTQTAPEQHQ